MKSLIKKMIGFAVYIFIIYASFKWLGATWEDGILIILLLSAFILEALFILKDYTIKLIKKIVTVIKTEK